MPKTDAGPQYMKAEDLIRDGEWKEYTLTIEEVIPAGTQHASDKSLIEHPILRFKGATKLFICGKTNQRLVVFATGTSDQQKWVGKKITLRACLGSWFGEPNIAAVRVAPPSKDGPRPFIKKKDYGTPLTGQKVGA